MASPNASKLTLLLLFLSLADLCSGSIRKLASLYKPPPTIFSYHHGALLEGDIPISILWYGKFTPSQKSIVSDFLLSLTPKNMAPLVPNPSVTNWWSTVDGYVLRAGKKNTQVSVAGQLDDEGYSMGNTLSRADIAALSARASPRRGGVALVLTSEDVAVEGFCMSSCGFHGSDALTGSAYAWVGNSASQCPGQCAWPFHQPLYGPQAPPLVSPNGDVGVDGMVINLATVLAGAATNPAGGGFFQGARDAPVEVAAVCPGVYGRGAYPGYAGDLLVDSATGASYNANGARGRKYLLPALFDAATSSCSTLV